MGLAVVDALVTAGCNLHHRCTHTKRIAGRLCSIGVVRAVSNRSGNLGSAIANNADLTGLGIHLCHISIVRGICHSPVTHNRQLIGKVCITIRLADTGSLVTDAAGSLRNREVCSSLSCQVMPGGCNAGLDSVFIGILRYASTKAIRTLFSVSESNFSIARVTRHLRFFGSFPVCPVIYGNGGRDGDTGREGSLYVCTVAVGHRKLIGARAAVVNIDGCDRQFVSIARRRTTRLSRTTSLAHGDVTGLNVILVGRCDGQRDSLLTGFCDSAGRDSTILNLGYNDAVGGVGPCTHTDDGQYRSEYRSQSILFHCRKLLFVIIITPLTLSRISFHDVYRPPLRRACGSADGHQRCTIHHCLPSLSS